MANKVAIVSDSTGCLTDEMLREHNIFTSHLMIVFGTESYQEFKELSPSKFLELMNAQEELPSTSQPAIGLTVELYEGILAQGYDEIIHITISSGLSGTYQSALNAADIAGPGKIHVVDSKTVIFPQGALAIAAAKLANEGKSVAEILARLEEIQESSEMIASVKSLDNLKKGGRLSNLEAYFGSLLQVKPIITMTEAGKLEAIEKVRTFKKALAHLVETAKEAALDVSYEIAVIHMENPEDAKEVEQALREIYPNHVIHVLPLSLVVSVHVGEGTIGVTWSKVE